MESFSSWSSSSSSSNKKSNRNNGKNYNSFGDTDDDNGNGNGNDNGNGNGNNSSCTSTSTNEEAPIQWKDPDETLEYIRKVSKEIEREHLNHKLKVLQNALLESRDKVLLSAQQKNTLCDSNSNDYDEGSHADKKTNKRKRSLVDKDVDVDVDLDVDVDQNISKINKAHGEQQQIVFPQLPDSSYSSNNENNNNNDSSDTTIIKYHQHRIFKISQPIQHRYIEGSHKQRPESTATIFLKGHYAVEDQKELTFLPYFGDKDTDENIEDVKDLFDLRRRESMVEHGPEYVQEEGDLIIRSILQKVLNHFILVTSLSGRRYDVRQKRQNHSSCLTSESYIKSALSNIHCQIAKVRDIEESKVVEIHERYFQSFVSDVMINNNASSSNNNRIKEEVKKYDNDNQNSPKNGNSIDDAISVISSSSSSSTSSLVSSSMSTSTSSPGRLKQMIECILPKKKKKPLTKVQQEKNNCINADGNNQDNSKSNEHNQIQQEDESGKTATRSTEKRSPNKNSDIEFTTSSSSKENEIISEQIQETCYEDAMDSFRTLFCRQCFVYDCNIHGNLPQPNLRLQTDLAMEKEVDKERELFGASGVSSMYSDTAYPVTTESENQKLSPTSSILSLKICQPCNDINIHNPKQNKEEDSQKDLTPLEKVICEHSYQIFRGDEQKISTAFGTSVDAVAKYVKERNISLHQNVKLHLLNTKTKKLNEPKRKKLRSSDHNKAMKYYNHTWLKRVQDAEIHPAFYPCNHDGPCSDDTCSCVQNANFCTKHCAWGLKSRNMFRGCNCKNGQCGTNSCPCFAAQRECDPDLCHNCGACTDPPNRPATTQRCRNDNISMRRHCHLLLAESGVQNAGWGIYTKNFLKKGTFVHEYIGELISQEEAERRGVLYDKMNRSYLFNLTSDTVIDASRKGNKMKFSNHSGDKPNCYAKILTVNGDSRVGLFAREDIEPQTEILFDYAYDLSMSNDLIEKSAKNFDWMKSPKMGKKIIKKHA